MKMIRLISTISLLALFSTLSAATYDVTEYGAKGDGKTINTQVIQQLIDRCAQEGGGTVFFPKGDFVTGTIHMKSNVNLYLDKQSTIWGSTEWEDYPTTEYDYEALSLLWSDTVLLTAENQKNITISGYGTINGNGDHPNFCTLTETKKAMRRPFMFRFVSCENIQVKDINLENSCYWTSHYLNCRGLRIHNVKINALNQHNNDGMDIDNCSEVIISDCLIQAEDDGICFKSNSPDICEKITITNCVVQTFCNGIKFGTETTGGFDGVTISNCVVDKPTNPHLLNGNPEVHGPVENPYDHPTYFGTPNGLAAIAIETVDGAIAQNINISDIIVKAYSTPIFLRLGFRGRKHVPDYPHEPQVGALRNINISNIIAESASPICSSIVGVPGHCVENIKLSNINYEIRAYEVEEFQDEIPENIGAYPSPEMWGMLPACGFYVRHAKNVQFDNVSFISAGKDNRSMFYLDDTKDVGITNARFMAPTTAELIQAENSQDISISNCYSSLEFSGLFKDLGEVNGVYVLGNILPNTPVTLKDDIDKNIRLMSNLFKK